MPVRVTRLGEPSRPRQCSWEPSPNFLTPRRWTSPCTPCQTCGATHLANVSTIHICRHVAVLCNDCSTSISFNFVRFHFLSKAWMQESMQWRFKRTPFCDAITRSAKVRLGPAGGFAPLCRSWSFNKSPGFPVGWRSSGVGEETEMMGTAIGTVGSPSLNWLNSESLESESMIGGWLCAVARSKMIWWEVKPKERQHASVVSSKPCGPWQIWEISRW